MAGGPANAPPLSGLGPRIKDHFENVMRSDKVPLFRDWETYMASLPVRKHILDGYQNLYDFPHWADAEDIKTMARMLAPSLLEAGNRIDVKYGAAPSAWGKTSSALPAFLESTQMEGGFTHYLYLPFSNNGYKNFGFDPDALSDSIVTAKRQGAAFIYECVKLLLDASLRAHILKLGEEVPAESTTLEAMSNYFREAIPEGRILIHVDEHRKMCPARSGMDEQSAAFRRGAIESLANVPGVTVFATYTGLLPEVAKASSGTCRDPVPVPPLDVDKAMLAGKELNFTSRWDPTSFDNREKRLWATLRFRLAAILSKQVRSTHALPVVMDWHVYLRGGYVVEEAADFLRKFRRLFTEAGTATEALQRCIKHCAADFYPVGNDEPDEDALRLLLGIPDNVNYFESLDRRLDNLLLVSNGRDRIVTRSLSALLSNTDATYPILYSYGRDLLRDQLSVAVDLLSSSPLEAAYAWVLSCKSARDQFLKFLGRSPLLDITCQRLIPGRLFSGTDTSNFNVSRLAEDVMYYVVEGDGTRYHPLCDIFFRTREGELVLIDCAGGNQGNVDQKVSQKKAFMENKNQETVVHFAILAPSDSRESTLECLRNGDTLTVVRRNEARKLLGGLNQLYMFS